MPPAASLEPARDEGHSPSNLKRTLDRLNAQTSSRSKSPPGPGSGLELFPSIYSLWSQLRQDFQRASPDDTAGQSFAAFALDKVERRVLIIVLDDEFTAELQRVTSCHDIAYRLNAVAIRWAASASTFFFLFGYDSVCRRVAIDALNNLLKDQPETTLVQLYRTFEHVGLTTRRRGNLILRSNQKRQLQLAISSLSATAWVPRDRRTRKKPQDTEIDLQPSPSPAAMEVGTATGEPADHQHIFPALAADIPAEASSHGPAGQTHATDKRGNTRIQRPVTPTSLSTPPRADVDAQTSQSPSEQHQYRDRNPSRTVARAHSASAAPDDRHSSGFLSAGSHQGDSNNSDSYNSDSYDSDYDDNAKTNRNADTILDDHGLSTIMEITEASVLPQHSSPIVNPNPNDTNNNNVNNNSGGHLVEAREAVTPKGSPTVILSRNISLERRLSRLPRNSLKQRKRPCPDFNDSFRFTKKSKNSRRDDNDDDDDADEAVDSIADAAEGETDSDSQASVENSRFEAADTSNLFSELSFVPSPQGAGGLDGDISIMQQAAKDVVIIDDDSGDNHDGDNHDDDNHDSATPPVRTLRATTEAIDGCLHPTSLLKDDIVHACLSMIAVSGPEPWALVDSLVTAKHVTGKPTRVIFRDLTAPAIILPLFVGGNHWTSVLLRQEMSGALQAELYDPMQGDEHTEQAFTQLEAFCCSYYPNSQLTRASLVEMMCPQQPNGYDCGVFVIAVNAHLMAGLALPRQIDRWLWRLIIYAMSKLCCKSVGANGRVDEIKDLFRQRYLESEELSLTRVSPQSLPGPECPVDLTLPYLLQDAIEYSDVVLRWRHQVSEHVSRETKKRVAAWSSALHQIMRVRKIFNKLRAGAGAALTALDDERQRYHLAAGRYAQVALQAGGKIRDDEKEVKLRLKRMDEKRAVLNQSHSACGVVVELLDEANKVLTSRLEEKGSR
ncbi:Ulp1 protease family protein [Colletotrichum tofieldiae]|nr:Ulp1 protease family protein [Colletotrichum tofieldiae]